MAEHKTEDTKQPLARLGARPFVGPAGAPGAARPFLRPASSGVRPAPGPFAPRPVTTRPALGVAPTAPPAAPIVPAPIDAATAQMPAAVSITVPERSRTEDGEGVTQAPLPNELSAREPAPRPITSEMVALDAVDAFDALWGTADGPVSPTPDSATVEQGASPPPLDESSLGTLDAPSAWSDDITAAVEVSATPVEPAASDAAGRFDMPAWLADDDDAVTGDTSVELPLAAAELPTDAEPTAALAGDQTPAWLEPATAAPVNDVAGMIEPPPTGAESALGDRPRFELVDDVLPATPDVDAAPPPRGVHVSAALGRLADRVSSGEIDVSSIAPDATDAAMLASVLAAILRGSSSR